LGAGAVVNLGTVTAQNGPRRRVEPGGTVVNDASGPVAPTARIIAHGYGAWSDFSNATASLVEGTVTNYGTIIGTLSDEIARPAARRPAPGGCR
jgi:hypothetical protein